MSLFQLRYMQSFHCDSQQFGLAPDSKQKKIPGAAYFKKLNTFTTEHVQVGELYLEYLNGGYQKANPSVNFVLNKFPVQIQAWKEFQG